MYPFLEQLTFWHWWAFGILLLAFEIAVPSTLLLWPAISAGFLGLLILIVPGMGWESQLLIFSVLAVSSSVGWRYWQKQNPTITDQPLLNRRASQYVGRRLTVTEAFQNGRGFVMLDDSRWEAEAIDGTDYSIGAEIEVDVVRGTLLRVRAVPKPG